MAEKIKCSEMYGSRNHNLMTKSCKTSLPIYFNESDTLETPPNNFHIDIHKVGTYLSTVHLPLLQLENATTSKENKEQK